MTDLPDDPFFGRPPRPLSAALAEALRPDVERLAAALGTGAALVEGAFRLAVGAKTATVDAEGLRSARLDLSLAALERACAPAHVAGLAALLRALSGLGGEAPQAPAPPSPLLEIRQGPVLAVLLERHHGWRSPHEYGEWEEPLATLRLRQVVPTTPRWLAWLCGALEPPPRQAGEGGVCRFCGRTFAARDYLPDVRCCHGCANPRLGIVF